MLVLAILATCDLEWQVEPLRHADRVSDGASAEGWSRRILPVARQSVCDAMAAEGTGILGDPMTTRCLRPKSTHWLSCGETLGAILSVEHVVGNRDARL